LVPAGALLEGAFCPACKLFPSFSFDHQINQQRFAAMCAQSAGLAPQGTAAAAAATAAASSASASTPPSTTSVSSVTGQSNMPKLSAYETELRRLTELAHTPRDLYTRPEAVLHADALARILDRTYRGALFAKQSPYLTQLIRSGQFRQLPLALPRLNTEVLAAEEHEARRGRQALRINAADSTITVGAAELSIRDMGSLSMRDFMQVFVTAVVPSLIDRPAALLDWTLLARSALAIEEERGWPAASAYVRNHLHRCVANGTDVGPFDKALWDDIRADLPFPTPAAAPAAGAQQRSAGSSEGARHSGGAAAPSSVTQHMKPRTCRDWNGLSGKTGCSRDKCPWKHVCCWAACSEASAHRGVDCPHNPQGAGRTGSHSPAVASSAAPSMQRSHGASAGRQ
jgi:hypothetical protein